MTQLVIKNGEIKLELHVILDILWTESGACTKISPKTDTFLNIFSSRLIFPRIPTVHPLESKDLSVPSLCSTITVNQM